MLLGVCFRKPWMPGAELRGQIGLLPGRRRVLFAKASDGVRLYRFRRGTSVGPALQQQLHLIVPGLVLGGTRLG